MRCKDLLIVDAPSGHVVILHFHSSMYFNTSWALVIPMANEEPDFEPFVSLLRQVLNKIGSGRVYFVVDSVSKDRTLELCQHLSLIDERFSTVWAPENRNVVDAYIRGYKVAYENGHTFILEMDAGMSHDPRAIPTFLRVLNEGNECVFGSRFANGGSMADSNFTRRLLSWAGTLLANCLLGTRMKDMTSGYQGFHKEVVKSFIQIPLKSKAHFYQTELRYLLRKRRYKEVPIHYRAPSPRVSSKAIINSICVLFFYTFQRFLGQAISL